MNTHTLIAAVSFALAATAFTGPARASEVTPESHTFVSSLSRDAVRADVLKARADGSLQSNEADYVRVPVFAMGKTRAAVVSETRAALASGEWAALNAEAASYLPGDVANSRATALLIATRR